MCGGQLQIIFYARRSIPASETALNFTPTAVTVATNYSLWQAGNLLVTYANMVYEVRPPHSWQRPRVCACHSVHAARAASGDLQRFLWALPQWHNQPSSLPDVAAVHVDV